MQSVSRRTLDGPLLSAGEPTAAAETVDPQISAVKAMLERYLVLSEKSSVKSRDYLLHGCDDWDRLVDGSRLSLVAVVSCVERCGLDHANMPNLYSHNLFPYGSALGPSGKGG